MIELKKVVAIDYDNTYTSNPDLFDAIIAIMKLSNSHDPIICTARKGDHYFPNNDGA